MNHPADDILSLAQVVATRLTDSDRKNVLDLIKSNELGVALETMSTQLVEHGAKCTDHEMNVFACLAKRLGIDPTTLEILQDLR